MPYRAPIDAYMRLLRDVVGYDAVAATDRFQDATTETVAAVLSEAGKLCEEVLAPLQGAGDTDPARLENGVVRTPKGFADGYRALAQGGWIATSAPPEYGGMGLPLTVTTCINEMESAACLSLQLTPLMSQGQIDALAHHATEDIKALYLPKLISGEWSGTMNLTEPQAGSDVGALTSKAEPASDGTYAITGQKIYISGGDNDFTENVCHLVLARLPDSVPGTKGISLFLVPKYLPNADGVPGVANTLKVVSLEHKMGMHGSATCVMSYEGAKGWLVGAPNDGMRAMFTMMNNARLGVGMQGIGVAEGAYQHALAYAQERRQGRSPEGTIIGHADVRRMLATMKADTFAARAIALSLAVAIDMAEATKQPEWRARAALLTPIVKAFGTETGIKVSDMGVQVHGGMGYIEETGAAQYLRDVRVTAIYEGTNGIQAMDLVGRKMMDGGDSIHHLLDEIEATAETARAHLPDLAEAVWQSAESLRETTEALVGRADVSDRFGGAVPFLLGFARVLGAHFHLRAALANPDGSDARLAAFYIHRLLPEHIGLLSEARAEPASLADIRTEDFVA